ncbi:hypothetical protein [Streptomyces sp. KL116D]|uniref:hypothetical protein n=1 Tax=Streptomyces sp. KL116D TaxID=3045152 RepID=UPI003556EE55
MPSLMLSECVVSTLVVEEGCPMGSLFEELEARESAARVQVEGLEAKLAEVADRLDSAREILRMLQIARETVAEVMAEMSAAPSLASDVDDVPSRDDVPGAEPATPYAGAERRMVGVLSVPNWQPGMGIEVLPTAYRDIIEVVQDAPEPVRAKQVVPRIGLPAEVGKIETTRAKLKRLAARGWLEEGDPGLFTVAHHRTDGSVNSS